MNRKNLLIFITIALEIACVGFYSSYNNVWKIPDTNLEIAVEKQNSTDFKNMVERKLIFRENHLDKDSFKLARTENRYSRLNVYQTPDNTFLIRDSFETYELNTQTKLLQKITPTESGNRKFIGAFDDNENGNWRFIPVSEREEIALGTKN